MYRLHFAKFARATEPEPVQQQPSYVDTTNVRVELRATAARCLKLDYDLETTLYTHETLEQVLRHADLPYALDALRESLQSQAKAS